MRSFSFLCADYITRARKNKANISDFAAAAKHSPPWVRAAHGGVLTYVSASKRVLCEVAQRVGVAECLMRGELFR